MTKQGHITQLPSPWEVEQAKQQLYTEERDKLHRELCWVRESAEKALSLLSMHLRQGRTHIVVHYEMTSRADNSLFLTTGDGDTESLLISMARRQGWDVKIERPPHEMFTCVENRYIIYDVTPLEGTFADDF